jgi:hypothetical protein
MNNFSQGNNNSVEQVAIDSHTEARFTRDAYLPLPNVYNMQRTGTDDDVTAYTQLAARLASVLRDAGALRPVAKSYIFLLESRLESEDEIAEATRRVANDNATYRRILTRFVSEEDGITEAQGLMNAVNRGLKELDHYI